MRLIAFRKALSCIIQRCMLFHSKTWLVMRLTTILLIVACLQVQANGYGQNISLSVQNVSLENVLKKIKKQAGYHLVYREEWMSRAEKVSVTLNNASITEALNACFKNQVLTYELVDKTIVIKKSLVPVVTPAIEEPAAGQRQDIVITGRVKDEGGNLLGGVSIIVKETGKGVYTAANGTFSISVTDERSVLVVSHVGMETQEITVGRNKTIDIILVELKGSMEDVVVVGYGVQSRRDVTGSITSVSGADIRKAAPIDIVSALQSRAAGVQVRTSDGAPGAGMSVQIRGANSFSSSNPLYVIDGIPYGGSNGSQTPSSSGGSVQRVNALASINPNDVESIEILKDASATAIYGSRGSNGVVIITTKRGKPGPDKVEYTGNASVSKPVRKLEVLDAYHFALMRNEGQQTANELTGTNTQLPYDGEMQFYPIANKFVRAPLPEEFIGRGTDWQDVIFQNAVTQNHTISVSGGSNAGNHLLSFNYVNQEGVIIGSKYSRFNIRTNMNRNIRDWLVIGTNVNIARETNNMVRTNVNDNVFAAGVTRSALVFMPTVEIIDTLTHTETVIPNLVNPYLYTTQMYNRIMSTSVFTSSYLEATLLKGLKFRQNVGYSLFNTKRDEYIPKTVSIADNGIAFVGEGAWQAIASESVLNYVVRMDKHSIGATVGGTFEKWISESRDNRVTNFPTDFFLTNNFGAATGIPIVSNGKSGNTLASGLARVNYNYDNRYYLTVSFRADGSSKFSKNNKWAYFPSAAFSWNIKEEKFLKESDMVSELKLRLSYGKTGNQAIGAYETQNKLTPSLYPIDGALISGFADNQPGNNNLKWETTGQYNIGIDLSFFKNRVGLVADYYHKETYDLLQSIVIPGSTGFTAKRINTGAIQNRGLELTLYGSPVRKKDFSWDVSLNYTSNRNKILSLKEGVTEQFASPLDHRSSSVPFIQKVGYPIGALYGRVEEGLYRNEAEVRAVPENAGLTDAAIRSLVGEIRYADLDGDGVVNDNDRRIIGDVNPDFFFGINSTLNYKNFDLNIFISGVKGGDIINMNNTFLNDLGGMYNTLKDAYDTRWTPENWEHATTPKAWLTYTRNFYITRRFMEDGSYIRLRNLALGYTFNHIRYFDKLRVYINTTNLFTITSYKGYDPDVNAFGDSPARRGVDYGSYPISKTFNLGVQVGL